MTVKQVKDALERFGVKLEKQDADCLAWFCRAMDNKQYGDKETASAYGWFKTGWNSGKEE